MVKKFSVLLIVAAVVMAVGLALADVHKAAYKGSAACEMCHKNMHKAVVDAYKLTSHPRAMQKADVAGAIVGDFSSNQSFTKDKVAYVLGSGRTQQAYLDANLQVLPAVWDVKTKAWQPRAAADGATQCVGCHTTGYDSTKKTFVQAGVGCEMCHGPGGDHVSGPNKTNIVNPKPLSSKLKAMICGQCCQWPR